MSWTGPHPPIKVEEAWDEFVGQAGGQRVADLLTKSPDFDNADYIFPVSGVVAELKELQTELSHSDRFSKEFDRLMERVIAEDPAWRPLLLGGDGTYPRWFYHEYVRIFRPPIARILKKANRQLRETKEHFGLTAPSGILLFVNDGFTSLAPNITHALVAHILTHSYSSIDCFVYLTVNRYVDLPESDIAHLIWAPSYSDRAQDTLVEFVNDLGRRWFDYLETKIGPFDERRETDDNATLQGSRAIVPPVGDES